MLTDRFLARTALSQRLFICLPAPEKDGRYPTSRIQKGPILTVNDRDLSGEGVGLGVPVIKFAQRAFFPGTARVIARKASEGFSVWVVEYDFNLVERVALERGHVVHNADFYRLIEGFAVLYRTIAIWRGIIERFDRALRFIWRLTTTFERTASVGLMRVSYCIDRRNRAVNVRVGSSRFSENESAEVILLNELDGSLFDRYSDSSGLELRGKDIGAWEKTFADCVTLTDSHHCVSFSVPHAPRSNMYRGREVAGGRLSWAGVAYVLSPHCASFEYKISICDAA
ncbi:MAG TPA: hypothetical protein VEG65_02005 [Candidatus Bathyarchaeia archaeon]|nr:hypothetical protein [Candidatus Bathyarchaeia archaeon]